MLIKTVKMYKIFFIMKLRLLRENWEYYITHIITWQAKRGYPRFRGSKTKEKTPKEK